MANAERISTPDLASVVFTIVAAEDTNLPADAGRILQAAFLNWFKQDHPELTAKLHSSNYQRPYTVSSLHGSHTRDGRWLRIRQHQESWFRVTGYEPHFIECLLASVEGHKSGPQPDDRRLVPGPVWCASDEHPAAALSSFSQLAADLSAAAESDEVPPDVFLRFESPTCFIENKMALPLPVPRHVFGYLANLWQLASPFALPIDDIQHFVESIHLAHARIDTRMVDLVKYRRVGFVGHTRFALHPALPQLYRLALHLLARFAFFGGVGSHTTMGLGQISLR